MEKVILNLQWVNFCFQNTWQSKDCIFRITCVRSLTEETWFSKTDISLISFQQLDLNWHDLWSMRVDSRIERLSNKKNIDRVCKILDTLKSWPPGGNTVDPEKENKQYSDQLGAMKDDQMMNQCTEDNGV